MKIHDTSHIALRRPLRKLSMLLQVVAAGGLILTATSRAALVFDNISDYEHGVAGATINATGSTPNTFMGGAYTLDAGTTAITGFDIYPYNGSGTTYTGIKINIFVWGAVNTGSVNDTTPAFSNLLGSYTFTSSGSFPSGFLFQIEGSPVGSAPGITLASPLAIPSTTIGLTFDYQGTTDGVNYSNVNNLSSIIVAGTTPTVGSLVLGGATGGYYRNANSEVNGNFTSTLRSLGGLTNQSVAVRVYGNHGAAPMAPTNLLVDDVSNPVGTEAVPYFGWLDNDTNASEIQTGYEILVATNTSDLDANVGDMWDSGKVSVSQENHVVYAGTPLTADTQYYWKVRTWNREGNVGSYSTNANFEVGLLSNNDWTNAMWIKRNTSVSDDYTYYRKDAPLPTNIVARATVYVTSVHKYALYVNGTLVGKGPTYQFPQYQYYNAYDITSLITPGATNVFAMFNHWFGGGSGRPTSSRGVLMKAIIHYTDGTSTNIVTDGTWLESQATSWVTSSPSPVSRGGSGSGYVERIDARNLAPAWNTNGFDDSGWSNPLVIGGQPNATWSGNLAPDLARIVETVYTPVAVTNLGGGQYIVDMGKLYSGVPSISFSGGASGTVVNMVGGFALLSTGKIDTTQNQTLNLSYVTILNGSNYTYQAVEFETMRYFWISNSPMAVTVSNFAFVERNSQMNDGASSFTSSNATLNAVWGLMKQTIPIDGQEEFIDSVRQKGGFLGDGYQESIAAMDVEDERVMTRNRLNEFIVSMVQFWEPPNAPAYDIGRMNAAYPDVNNARDIPDYTQMYLDWVWEYYLQTGDIAFLNTNYTQLTNIAQYVNRDLDQNTGLITNLLGGTSSAYSNGIIDWPPNMQFGYDTSTVRGGVGCSATVIDGWAWEDYDVMSRIANELGNSTDTATYRGLADAMAAAINTNLINGSGVYVDGLLINGARSAHASQHANAFPLSLGIVPSADVSNVTSLVIISNMSVSALGIIQVERALGEANQGPALLNLFTNATNYGWARILSLNGTATWESWTANTDGNSESHGWGEAGLDGYVRYILGVEPLKAQFEQVQIFPLDFGNMLPYVSGSLLTDRGTIGVEWDRSFTLGVTQYHLTATIPVNVTATVYVPQGSLTNTTITVDGTNITATLTNLVGTANGYLGVSGLGSGTHNIQRIISVPAPVVAIITPATNIVYLASTNETLLLSATASNTAPANPMTTTWSQTSGPGTIAFASPNALTTAANFSANGTYLITFTANNSSVASSNLIVIVGGVTDGLAGWWKMDETNGLTASDSSGNGLNASVTGGSFTNGYISNALYLPGAADDAKFISSGDSDQITVAAWVFADGRGGSQYPFILGTPGYHFSFRFDGGAFNNALDFATAQTPYGKTPVNGEWLTASNTISSNAWYHVAVSYDKGNLTNVPALYINGVRMPLFQSTAPSTNTPSYAGTNNIGNRLDEARGWDGLIDDLRIYNRLISDVEVQALASVASQNREPFVNAGTNQTVFWIALTHLNGIVTDDGRPNPPGAVTATWSEVSGPGAVAFGNVNAPVTTAGFSAPGSYQLQLAANDGQVTTVSGLTITAITPPSISLLRLPNAIQLSWPTNAGITWGLQFQTNPPPRGLGTNWLNMPGPITNPFVISVDPGNGSAFYRLLLMTN